MTPSPELSEVRLIRAIVSGGPHGAQWIFNPNINHSCLVMSRYASLDVGSNTVRLLVAEKSGEHGFQPIRVERIITRLGGNFTAAGELDQSAIERTLAALHAFAGIAREEKAEAVFAAGTGVLRKAKNGKEFIRRVREETGLPLRLISGEEEGRLMLKGVLWSLKDPAPTRLVVDIGGWSTEVIWAGKGRPRKILSTALGVVALTETLIFSDPPGAKERKTLEENIGKMARGIRKEFEENGCSPSDLDKDLIGTAGSATTLAAIDLKLPFYHHAKINGHQIPRAILERIYDQLISLPAAERLKIPGLEKGREDLVIPGTAIVLGLLEAFCLDNLLVIDSGLLEGVMLDGLEQEERSEA